MYFSLGNGDNSLGGGSLLGLLGSGELDLSGDAIEVTSALAGQTSATVGVFLCQLQTLKCLQSKIEAQDQMISQGYPKQHTRYLKCLPCNTSSSFSPVRGAVRERH